MHSIRPVFLYKYVNKYPCLFLLKGAALYGYKVAIDGPHGAYQWVERYLAKGAIDLDNFVPGSDKFVGYYWNTAGQTETCECLMDKITTGTYWYVKGLSFDEAKKIADEYECEEWEVTPKPTPKPYYPPYSPVHPHYIPVPIPIPWQDHKSKPWQDHKQKPWQDHKPKPWHHYVKPDYKPEPHKQKPWQDHKPKPWHDYVQPDYKPEPHKQKPWQDHKPKPWYDYVQPDEGIIPGLLPRNKR